MQITRFEPDSGTAGTSVTIALTDMPSTATQSNTKVFLGLDNPLTTDEVTVDEKGNGTVSVTIPPDSQTAKFTVVVTGTDPVEAQSDTLFTVDENTQQALFTTMSPNPVKIGGYLLLNGEHLDEITTLKIGAQSVRFTVRGTSQISVQVPASLVPGTYFVVGMTNQEEQVRAPGQLTVTSE